MYCLNCGGKLDDGQLICPYCGQKIDPSVQQSVVRHINEKQTASSMYDPEQSQYIPQGVNVTPGNNLQQRVNATPDNNTSQGINVAPGNNMQQRQNVTPGMNTGAPSRMTADLGDGSSGQSRKRANLICIISTCLMVAPFFLFFFWAMFHGDNFKFLDNIILSIIGILPLASIVLMVFVRIKYPKNTFGKLLMWAYIALVVIAVLLIVALIAFCYYIIESCRGL